MLALVPMLVALMTVPARSENSAEVGQVAGSLRKYVGPNTGWLQAIA